MIPSRRFLSRSLLAAALSGAVFVAVLLCSAQTVDVRRNPFIEEPKLGNVDWAVYRGDPKGNQYAPLAQINATNVHKLQRVWEFHTDDASSRSTMYANPIVVNG